MLIIIIGLTIFVQFIVPATVKISYYHEVWTELNKVDLEAWIEQSTIQEDIFNEAA